MFLAKIMLPLLVLSVTVLCKSDLLDQETDFIVIGKDQTDTPIAGATAKLLSVDRVLQLQAGSDGRFLFTHLSPGTYDLEISAQGFESRKVRNVRIPRADTGPLEITLPIKFMECGRFNLIDYKNLEPNGILLFGYVIDEDSSRPLSKVQLDLLKTGEKHVLTTTRSDKKGEFTFGNLPPGRYDVHARKDFYRPADVNAFLVPRENLTKLTIFLHKADHIQICQ